MLYSVCRSIGKIVDHFMYSCGTNVLVIYRINVIVTEAVIATLFYLFISVQQASVEHTSITQQKIHNRVGKAQDKFSCIMKEPD